MRCGNEIWMGTPFKVREREEAGKGGGSGMEGMVGRMENKGEKG